VLTVELAHEDAPVPGQLWSDWHPDPLVLLGLLAVAALYWQGHTRGRRDWRGWCFAGGLAALAVALLSPLDALSRALASAHMVQHLLITLVAAPLLAVSAPAGPLLRGGPAAARGLVSLGRRRLPFVVHVARNPAVVWLLHVGVLWAWHSAALYDAALRNPLLHALEHLTFLLTAVLLWRVVIGARAVRVSPGLGVLLVFATTLQSGLLSLLLTFASTPWYVGYTTTTRPWGLEQLADQHLAGAIMWVPAGFVYLGVALTLLVGWVRGSAEPDETPTGAAVPEVPVRLAGRV
jgi:putative membrane protein